MQRHILHPTLFGLLGVLALGGCDRATTPPAKDRAPATADVEAILSVGMTVGDMDRSVDFYSKVLSFEKVSDVEVAGTEYAASKGGVMLLMKSIAQEVAPYRIRVNSICPGAIRTPINRDAWDTPEAYNALLKLIPYKRIGEIEDLGRVAVFLASDDADYIHGASLFVDGGMTLYPGFEAGG